MVKSCYRQREKKMLKISDEYVCVGAVAIVYLDSIEESEQYCHLKSLNSRSNAEL